MKASICIPTYNQGQFVAECVQSALAQDYTGEFEVVISVNHCTDDTEEALKPFLGDPRLVVLRPPQFLGALDNFRFVLAHGRGEYVSFLCSDDAVMPGFLRVLAKTLDEHPNVVLAQSASVLIDEHSNVIGPSRLRGGSRIVKSDDAIVEWAKGQRGVGDALLFRKSAYEQIGDIPSGLFDWDICMKLVSVGDWAYHDEILSKYRQWLTEDRGPARSLMILREWAKFSDYFEKEFETRSPEAVKVLRRSRLRGAYDASLAYQLFLDAGLEEEARQAIAGMSDRLDVRILGGLARNWGLAPVLGRGRSGLKRSKELVKRAVSVSERALGTLKGIAR